MGSVSGALSRIPSMPKPASTPSSARSNSGAIVPASRMARASRISSRTAWPSTRDRSSTSRRAPSSARCRCWHNRSSNRASPACRSPSRPTGSGSDRRTAMTGGAGGGGYGFGQIAHGLIQPLQKAPRQSAGPAARGASAPDRAHGAGPAVPVLSAFLASNRSAAKGSRPSAVGVPPGGIIPPRPDMRHSPSRAARIGKACRRC